MIYTSPPIRHSFSLFFFFNATAPTEIYTLSLHDALPDLIANLNWMRDVLAPRLREAVLRLGTIPIFPMVREALHMGDEDRKSTRLNSSHTVISYAVFCLKKKKVTHL